MSAEKHLEEARKLYQKAVEEFKKAKEKKELDILRDSCAKDWLSAIEATRAIFLKGGVKEEELPRADRGRRYMVHKHGDKEVELYYHFLRNALYIEGYYEGTVEFEEMERYLEYLHSYLQKVEGLRNKGKV